MRGPAAPPSSPSAAGAEGGSAGSVTPGLLTWHDCLNPDALAPAPGHTLSVSPSHVHLGLRCPKEGTGGLSSWSPALAPSCPLVVVGSPDGTACLSCTCPSRHHPPGLAPARTPAWRTPPPRPASPKQCPDAFSGPPMSVQSRDGCVDLGSTGGWAFPAVGRDLGTSGGGARTEGLRSAGWGLGRCRGPAQRVLSCRGSQVAAVQSHLGPSPCGYCCRKRPPGQQSPRLGGGRVAAGRGLDQECVSRNVTALPTEWGGGRGG